MIFDRMTLIDRIKAEIERRETETIKRNEQAQTEHAEAASAYWEATGGAWNEFANLIKRRIRLGQPVTTSDIPSHLRDRSYGTYRVWTWDAKPPKPERARVAELHTLLAILESTDTPTVTFATLDRMGFKINDLFRKG